MAPKTTSQVETKKLIEDMNKRLTTLESQVKYEAIKEVEALKEDLAKLEDTLKTYATNEAIFNIAEKVGKIEKIINWVGTIVVGAVLLAVIQLVLRKPS